MRILLCEDQDAIRRMIEALVGASGHEVTGVRTGAEAIELALKEPYDVVLLDLMLPGTMDGFEVCTRLRSDPVTKGLPIVIISALDDKESRERATLAGATAYHAKPFRPLELLEYIGSLKPAQRPAG
ncbi:response regulator transcription factor [Chondromyces apiculatus]|uniref:Diguanylate cyclase n=1 Tax=Chondromyces apiculatus DSM 436 TaxID=1192034 RepID=A0A017SY28_9BACT|nr:response regulator [Chondromyces apiculatus]EYF01662.1 diguanylate cyclase [Chondromyces apiculatus DSM 436]